MQSERKSKEEHKPPSCAAALKRKINTNLRRKFSKQNIVKKDNKSTVKSSISNTAQVATGYLWVLNYKQIGNHE